VITDFFLTIILSVVEFFDSFLPHVTMPSWLAGSTVLPSGVASTIGGMMAAVAPFIPVDVVLTVLTTVMLLWPVIFAYVVFNWVYRHVPSVAGFGLGAG
jgi:hypothetical protein